MMICDKVNVNASADNRVLRLPQRPLHCALAGLLLSNNEHSDIRCDAIRVQQRHAYIAVYITSESVELQHANEAEAITAASTAAVAHSRPAHRVLHLCACK